MKILYIFFIAVFMFGNSISSLANRDRSDRRDRNRLETRHEKTDRKNNQEARRGRSNGASRSSSSARSGSVIATQNELTEIEDVIVEEETELKIAPIKKTINYQSYSSNLQDIISNASSQYSKVGRNVKRYSKSPSVCIADFSECVFQTSICDKGLNKCLNSDKLELEKTTWFCQQKFLDKCHPDSHETMYERFISDLAKVIETRRQRKLASDKKARQIALAKQKAYDEKQIYKLACKNAGGMLAKNGRCGFEISLFYPGGNIEQTVIGEKAYCNTSTMGYDPVAKKQTEQKHRKNTLTAIGAGVGAIGGAFAGHEIEENIEEREEDLENYLTIQLKKGLPTERQKLYNHCKGKSIEKKEIGMREGKCIRLIDAFYEELEYEAPESVDGSKGYEDELEKCVKHAKTENECKTLLKDLDPYAFYKDKFKKVLETKIKKVNQRIKEFNTKAEEKEEEEKETIEPDDIETFVENIKPARIFELWYESSEKTSIIKKCFSDLEFQENTCQSALSDLNSG